MSDDLLKKARADKLALAKAFAPPNIKSSYRGVDIVRTGHAPHRGVIFLLKKDEWSINDVIALFCQENANELYELISSSINSRRLKTSRTIQSNTHHQFYFDPLTFIEWAISKQLQLLPEVADWYNKTIAKPTDEDVAKISENEKVTNQPEADKPWLVSNQREQRAQSAESTRQQQPSGNNIALSGILNEPSKKDDWFYLIDDMTKEFYSEHGKAPNSTQAWGQLWTNPPQGYAITNGTDKGENCLNMPGVKPLCISAFNKRWNKYTSQKSL